MLVLRELTVHKSTELVPCEKMSVAMLGCLGKCPPHTRKLPAFEGVYRVSVLGLEIFLKQGYVGSQPLS